VSFEAFIASLVVISGLEQVAEAGSIIGEVSRRERAVEVTLAEPLSADRVSHLLGIIDGVLVSGDADQPPSHLLARTSDLQDPTFGRWRLRLHVGGRPAGPPPYPVSGSGVDVTAVTVQPANDSPTSSSDRDHRASARSGSTA
jgi:hypothetical protein